MQQLNEGDPVICRNIHHNSKGAYTVGEKYPVVKVYQNHNGTRTFNFSIEDDNGKLKILATRTKMFARVDGKDLYNDDHVRIMKIYTLEIEALLQSWNLTDKGPEMEVQYEEDKLKVIHKYLPQLFRIKRS